MTISLFKTTSAATIIFAATSTYSTAIAGNTDAVAVVPMAIAPAPAATPVLAFPAVFGAASAVPAPGGSGYAALNYTTPRGGIAGADGDGDLALGYTFGNPISNVSASVGVNITSLTDNFGDSGNFNVSLARMLTAGNAGATFVGASAGNLGGWGDAAGADMSYSVQVSHLMGVGASDIPLQLTAGYGNETTLSDDGLGTVGDGFFVGLGAGVSEAVSLSMSATETQLNLGATASIAALNGTSVSVGVYDVTENADRQQVSLTIAYGF